MIRFIISLCFILITIFFNLNVYGLDEDKQKPIYLEADSVRYDYKNGIVYYDGHVNGTQGTTTLNARSMQVYYNNAHKIKKVVAKGDLAHYSTQLKRDKSLLHAWAKTITYYPIASKATLIDDAKIQYNQNFFSGPCILYDIAHEVIASRPQKNNKAKIILEPFKTLKQE